MLLIKDISQYWTYAIVYDSWTLLQNKLLQLSVNKIKHMWCHHNKHLKNVFISDIYCLTCWSSYLLSLWWWFIDFAAITYMHFSIRVNLCFTCDDGLEKQSFLFESHPLSRYEGELKRLLFPEANRTQSRLQNSC